MNVYAAPNKIRFVENDPSSSLNYHGEGETKPKQSSEVE